MLLARCPVHHRLQALVKFESFLAQDYPELHQVMTLLSVATSLLVGRTVAGPLRPGSQRNLATAPGRSALELRESSLFCVLSETFDGPHGQA